MKLSQFKQMQAVALSILLCFMGLSACSDDYHLDDGRDPAWLGGSIYDELKNPKQDQLTGTFTNYVRLIDDLGYTQTLSKTGSKTVFPANDEAFERFFKDNPWGVKRYEELSLAQKKMLLYGSMLDNALLVSLLSNISNGATDVTSGVALKHATGANVTDSVTHIYIRGLMPGNNRYWDKFVGGIDLVMDATRPMMVHFTEKQMISNNITLAGDNSDFEVITGQKYDANNGTAYIFRNPIIHQDVTCLNGYIHQLQNVLLPPGNLAEVIRTNGESKYFSRMLDRFSVPVYTPEVTNNYNDFATVNNLQLIDSIYEKRYYSQRSQGGVALTMDPNQEPFNYPLNFDPGWNGYYVQNTNALADLEAMFVPTDKAIEEYFLPGGAGAFLIDQFGKKPNTVENLEENIDSVRIDIIQAFLNNLMKGSFVGTVPSKFNNIMDDASDPMGLSLNVINKNANGQYDIKIANNGVAYMLNRVFAPNRYVSVFAPTLFDPNMQIMLSAITDGENGNTDLNLGLNFYAYLLAMSANYALFIPSDGAFAKYYIDPTFLKHSQPRALKFYIGPSTKNHPSKVYCSSWKYNPKTCEVEDSIGLLTTAQFHSQLKDILNYHTIVLNPGEKLGQNRYYKNKLGGEIYIDGDMAMGGGQIDNGLAPSVISHSFNEKNGTAYKIDNLIQAPQNSVYDVLSGDSRFSKFMELCTDTRMDALMEFASDSLSKVNKVTHKKRLDAYHPFAAKNGLTDNVNYFNAFNYTVYAPNNDAMDKAYAKGLPSWDDIDAIYNQWADRWVEDQTNGTLSTDTQLQDARNRALAMVEEINSFIRYHFQNNSIYVDNTVIGGEFSTVCANELGIRERVNVEGGNNQFTVVDNSGQRITISQSSGRMINKMTRDYVFNVAAKVASEISTSSFAVVQEVAIPFNHHKGTDRYDGLWTGNNAKKKLAAYRQNYESNLYKLY